MCPVPGAGVAGTQSAAMLTTEMEPLVRISGSPRALGLRNQWVGSEAVGMFSGFRRPDDFIVNEPQDLGFSGRSCASVSPNRKMLLDRRGP